MLDGSLDERRLLQLSASVEKYSEHPLARAFVRRAETMDLHLSPVTDIKVIEGKGIQGVCEGRTVLVGSARLAAGLGITLSADAGTELQARSAPPFVVIDGKPAGIVFLLFLKPM